MNQIISTLQLENVQTDKLQKFIGHWKEIKDLPCENIKFTKINETTLIAKLYYPLNIFDKSVTQFMTVLYGELSFVTSFGKVKFIDLELPDEVYNWFLGPKFGADELKQRFSVSDWPMLIAIIKPSLSPELNIEIINEKIKSVLDGGFHGIKDDEMQGNLPYVSLKERIKLAKIFVKYIPTVNLDSVEEYKKLIGTKESKAIGMILVNASTIGFPMLHEIRKITNVPILSHVALQGVYSSSFTPKIFAKLHRLFGCDAFTNPIGEVNYFNVTRDEEKEMAIEFTKELSIKKTLPLLTGGARLNNLFDIITPYEEMKVPYGVVFGSLIFASEDTPTNMCRKTIQEVNKHKNK